MIHSTLIRRGIAVLLVGACFATAHAQEQSEKYTNLKVLPKDIAPEELRSIMNGFTRSLGVRCAYCHVGEEGKPMRHEDFSKDDKPTKRKARDMMRMMKDINDNYLAHLESRSTPSVSVQCVTCHRGAPQPRLLQDVLQQAYDTGGLDSSLARYHALRDRYYGRFTYDFGEVPLADLATKLRHGGHAEDALRLQSFNVEMNPSSAFAKRQYAGAAIETKFQAAGPDSGTALYRALRQAYGASVVSEELMNQVGYDLLGAHQEVAAITVLRLNADDNPKSGNAYDSLGEAYAQHGDRKLAIAAYQQSLGLDPTNDHAQQMLVQLKAKPKK